ncbi:MAG: choice-of-anchor D domain-containing protein [Planctomycetes bacterium]|nr:choice-of-anchor D domain-containing protein [Planctomycetota bacterium]
MNLAARIVAYTALLGALAATGPDRAGAEEGEDVRYTAVDLGAGYAVELTTSGRVVYHTRGPTAPIDTSRTFVVVPPNTPGASWTSTEIVSGDAEFAYVEPHDVSPSGVVVGASDLGPFRWTAGTFELIDLLGPVAPHSLTGCDKGAADRPESFSYSPTGGLGRSGLVAVGDDGTLLGFARYQVYGFDDAACPRPVSDGSPAGDAADAAWLAKVADWFAYWNEWASRDMFFIGASSSPFDAAHTPGAHWEGTVSDIGTGGHIVGLKGGRAILYRSPANPGGRFLDAAPDGFEWYEVGHVNAQGRVAGAFSPSSGPVEARVWEPDGTRTDLPGPANGDDARALAVNSDGDVVGQTAELLILERGAAAALWTDDGLHDLNTLVDNTTTRFEDGTSYTFLLTKAVAIGDDGRILCQAVAEPGQIEPRIVVLTPICDTIGVTPTSIDFGDVEIGRTVTAQVTVENCSGQTASVTARGGSGPFRISGATRKKVKDGASYAFAYTFRPTAGGAFAATVSITGPGGIVVPVALRGRGVAPGPQLFVFPNPMDFGPTVRGVDKYPVIIQNLRDEPIKVTFGDLAAPFATTGPRTVTIAARKTVMREVSFKPQNQGVFTGAMTLTTNVKGAPVQSVSFSGQLARTVRVKRVIRGSAEFRKFPGDWTDLAEGAELDEQTEISTDPGSEVELEYPDGSTTIIRPASQIKVLALFTAGGVVTTEILLKVGELAAKVKKADVIRSDFKVRSPTATASVRGTEFDVVQDDVAGTTTVRVREGVVEVDPEGAGLKTVFVKAGLQVTVTATSVGKLTRLPK